MKKFLKSSLSLILAITIILSSAIVGLSEVDFGSLFAVKTQAASTSDLTLTLSSDGTYYSVTNCNTSASGNLTIPSTYNGKPVKSIGNEAFYNCSKLTSIAIPDSVTSIGSYAFSYCTRLTAITIPNSVTTIGIYTFCDCSNLTSVTIPDSVISIGDAAFYNCSGLTTITIPDSVTTIGSSAFRNCTSLKSITLPFVGSSRTDNNSCSAVFGYIFGYTTSRSSSYSGATYQYYNSSYSYPYYHYFIPSSLETVIITDATQIPYRAFYNCTNITSISIPDGVKSIGQAAFCYCTSLTIITIPNSVTTIGSYAFQNSSNLTSITIPNGVTTIDSYTFYGCTSLTKITIPNSVTTIGSYAFQNCSNLTSITIPDSVTSIGGTAFQGCTSLESITLPFVGSSRSANNSYSAVFGYIFGYTTSSSSSYTKQYYDGSGNSYYYYIPSSLKTVIITDATQIPYGAFSNCTNITSISISDGVKSIGQAAFYYCESLTTITIPDSVTSISQAAFRGCESLESITLPFVGSSRTASNTNDAVLGYIFGYSSWSYDDTTTQYYKSSDCYYYYIPTSLKTVIITDATQIPYGAFYNCTNITSISISDSVASIGSDAFYNSGHYNNDLNWENGVLYIGNHLIEAKTSLSGEYVVKEGTKTIVESAFYNCKSLTSITIPNSVTSIDRYAFNCCESLTTTTIPDSVTSIGEAAFKGCTSLESITLPFVGSSRSDNNSYSAVLGYIFGYTTSSSSSYSGATNQYYNSSNSYPYYHYYIPSSLKTVIITDATYIPYKAFYNCSNLTSITIPNSVTSINDYAFYNCSALSVVYYDGNINQKNNISIGSYNSSLTNAIWHIKCTTSDKHTYSTDFDNKCNICEYVRVVESVTKTYGVLTYCINPDENRGTITITDVSETAMGAISVPSEIGGYKVVCIGSNAFENCTSITSITIPNSVTSIGNAAFKGCTSLENISLPFVGSSRTDNNSYSAVFGYIFGYTTSSSSSYSGATNQYYNSSNSYPYYHYYIPSSLKNVIITNVTHIPYRAFYNCNNLTSITIPNSVTSINNYAFYNCSALSVVYYDGNINQKNNISIGSYNSCLTNAIWHIKCTTSDKHTYSTDFDNKCNVCGYVRVIEPFIGTYGIFTYSINPDENRGAITITDVSETAMGAISVPSEIGGYKVVCIGSNAFENCTSITSITIPNTVKSIESYAFYGCSRLTSLTIPDSVEAMGNYMLSGCTGLLELKLPFIDRKFSYLFGENQYEISNDYVPRSLKQITINSGDIADSSFSGCNNISIITIGDKVTSIGDSAFYACNSITKVTIGNGVKTIGSYAFQNCVSLTQVTIGKSVETIGTAAFKNCESLLKVIVPNSTTKIKDSAFENCYNLAALTLGSKVDQIGNYSFRNCWRLTGVSIPDSTTLIGSGAFRDCSSLKKVTFGKNVTTIFDYAFEGCSELENIILPSSATSIGEYAFSNCSSLKRATIRGRTNHINNGTFEGCSSLVTVAFPKNVTTIAYNAFNCCYSLKEVWYEGSKADKNQILVAAGNNYIRDANWYYSSFDTVTHKYSTVCDEECDICGEIRTVNNHESDAGTVTKNATYTATGIKVYKCTECGEVLETAVIPQLKPATPKLTKVVNTASGAQITWSASEGADNYIVYRRSYNATTKQWSGWSKLKEDVTSTYYLDGTVKSGTYYRYTVRATNEGGISGYNTSGLKTYFLSIPKATTANSNSGVTVKWGKVTGATGYIVYRKTGNGKWQNLGKTTGTSFTDKTAKAGVTYRYTVKAYYGSYVSAYNTNGYAVRRLLTPTLKSVTSAKAGVTFKWNKVTGATGYTIYRKTGNGGWVKLATVTGNSAVSYLDKTAKKGVTYTYTVRAYYGTSTSYYNTKGLSIKDKY